MNLFRVRGIQLAIHSSFFLLLAYVGWDGWSDPDPGGWLGAAVNMGILLAFFVCVVLHELGHSFTARRFGVGVRRILLLPIGGMAEFDSIPKEPARELLITLAGPAVNFAIAGVLACFVSIPRHGPLEAARFTVDLHGIAQLLLQWNLIMGCFNLVPVFPMDGGRILRALLATKLSYLTATRIAARVGKTLAAAAVAAALLAPELHLAPERPYLLAALFAFIFFAGDFECRAVERRETEEAHWQQAWRRLYAAREPIEPPLLSP